MKKYFITLIVKAVKIKNLYANLKLYMVNNAKVLLN